MQSIAAEPHDFASGAATTALVIIDRQRDFLEPGGFGAALGTATPGPCVAFWCAANQATTSYPELVPAPGEPVVDKPGKGAFYATDLEAILRSRGMARIDRRYR